MKNPNSPKAGAFQMSFMNTLIGSMNDTKALNKSTPPSRRFYWDKRSNSYEVWHSSKGVML
ncbi:hypothetical protein GCM10008927_06430 [Amylibacter ulvae]|uniref:Uncharacterized protein n=1 Tax=Paramylibacter ulvae TaxID=1651968 RepID=A0ABQ3CWC6_9RHOB|nr:hypothetical protein [Amylibacter ulvae]GHA44349.1 hypothetical protein GCM10008927_06430 [Amylibacter ulvae]